MQRKSLEQEARAWRLNKESDAPPLNMVYCSSPSLIEGILITVASG